MAIRWWTSLGDVADGARDFSVPGDSLRKWFVDWSLARATIVDLGGGRKYLTDTAGTAPAARTPTFAAGLSEFWFGCRIWPTRQGRSLFAQFQNEIDSMLFRLVFNEQGRVGLALGTGGTVDVGQQSEGVLAMDTWNYLEMRVLLSSTIGEVQFRINGVTETAQTGLNTGTTELGAIIFGIETSSADWNDGTRITDFYVDDAQFRGPLIVPYSPCDQAGSSADFTPVGSPTNHENVDEIGSDGDGTYNESTVAGDKDSLGHSAATPSGTIIGVQPVMHARKDGVGPATLQPGILSGVTESLDAAQTLFDDYRGVVGSVQETDPDTAAAWTQVGVDAAETVYVSG